MSFAQQSLSVMARPGQPLTQCYFNLACKAWLQQTPKSLRWDALLCSFSKNGYDKGMLATRDSSCSRVVVLQPGALRWAPGRPASCLCLSWPLPAHHSPEQQQFRGQKQGTEATVFRYRRRERKQQQQCMAVQAGEEWRSAETEVACSGQKGEGWSSVQLQLVAALQAWALGPRSQSDVLSCLVKGLPSSSGHLFKSEGAGRQESGTLTGHTDCDTLL